jgi:hypothetical protein
MIQTRPTPFRNGLLGDSWWYWFKHRHLKLNHVEGLDISTAQGLTTSSCNLFYPKLTSLDTQHQYKLHHIWNCDEIGIKVGRQSGARIITKKGSHQVYNNIPKSREWLTINCAMNVTRRSIPWFYIF